MAVRQSAVLQHDPTYLTARELSSRAATELMRNRFFLHEKVQVVQTYVRREKKVAVAVKEQWKLETSIWAPRKLTCDSHDFLDRPEVLMSRFDETWERALACGLEKHVARHYTPAEAHSSPSSRSSPSPSGLAEEAEYSGGLLDKLYCTREVLERHMRGFYALFDFYASISGGFDGTISLNPFSQLIEDCSLASKESKHCKKADFDRVFIATDVASSKLAKLSPEAGHGGVNRVKSLSADEFMALIVNVATMRGILEGGPRQCETLPDALDRMFNEEVLPKVRERNGEILVDPNVFRWQELYVEEVDVSLRKHEPSLRVLFTALCRGKKLLSFDNWRAMTRRLGLFGLDLSERDAALAFVWARMAIVSPYSDRGVRQQLGLPFESFIEALCRLARRKAFPTDDEIAEAGFDTCGQYMVDLRENHPGEYEQLLRSRNTPWGVLPLAGPPLGRCVDHLISMIIHTASGGKGRQELKEAVKLERYFFSSV